MDLHGALHGFMDRHGTDLFPLVPVNGILNTTAYKDNQRQFGAFKFGIPYIFGLA